jgi:hypothetical protein
MKITTCFTTYFEQDKTILNRDTIVLKIIVSKVNKQTFLFFLKTEQTRTAYIPIESTN